MNKLIVLVLLSQLSMAVTAHIGVDFHAKVKVSDKVRNFIRNIQRAAEAGYAAYKDHQEGAQVEDKPDEEKTDPEGDNFNPVDSDEKDPKKSDDEEDEMCKRSGARNCKKKRAVNNINV